MSTLIIQKEVIINSIINKGGLMGKVAELYKHNSLLSDQFILECFEQCQVEEMAGFWGEELVCMISEYRNIYRAL